MTLQNIQVPDQKERGVKPLNNDLGSDEDEWMDPATFLPEDHGGPYHPDTDWPGMIRIFNGIEGEST